MSVLHRQLARPYYVEKLKQMALSERQFVVESIAFIEFNTHRVAYSPDNTVAMNGVFTVDEIHKIAVVLEFFSMNNNGVTISHG